MNDKSDGKSALPMSESVQSAASLEPAPREIEIKFRANRDAVEAVTKLPLLEGAVFAPARELVSVYYDTPDKALRLHGIALRVRKKGRAAAVLGVKWEGRADEGVFSRPEVEVACRGGRPDLQLFELGTRARLVELVGERALVPIFETRVKRRVAKIRSGHSDIEMAFDEGVVIAGEAQLPIGEIEVELKTGNQQDLLDFAVSLAEGAALHLDFDSKSDRGYQLAAGEGAKPQKAATLMLRKATNIDDLMAAVMSHSLGHFVANWSALRESDAPESIHQLRVALRRMRSMIGVFRRIIKLSELEDIRSEAKKIASGLGLARECDAFRLNALAGPLGNRSSQLKGAVRLLEAVETRRRLCYADARRIMTDTATTVFVLRVQSFVHRRAWRTAVAPGELGFLISDAKSYAAEVLERLRRRALKRGKQLPDIPDPERHELRIELKNLRYAAEFFGGLFGEGKNVRSYLKILADLQEDLGAHNDAATAEAFVEGLDLAPDSDLHFAAGYLLGWYRSASVAADINLIQKWKSFKRADGFWE